MADRAKKITELDPLTSPGAEDVLVIVDKVSNTVSNTTTYTTKNVTVSNFLGNTSANVTIKSGYYINANNAVVNNFIIARKQTPVSSSGTSDKAGMMWFDDNYVYVATANGTIKRAALSTF
jgi:hypothetical protein